MAVKCPEFNLRLQTLVQLKGWTVSHLARLMAVDPKAVKQYLDETMSPGIAPVIALLQSERNLSPDWLLLGVGDPYREDNTPDGGQLSGESHDENFRDIVASNRKLTESNSKLSETIAVLTKLIAGNNVVM